MGTKVHCKSYLPGYYSMRDLNEDSSSSSWPLCYGDKPVTNGQYFNGFMPRTIIDGYPGYEKDALKQKMLEHEAVFKNQVYELHRLYRIQRDMMEEAKRKESRFRSSMEPSSSSSHDARKWHMAGFPLLNPGCDRTSISGVEIVNSPMSCTKGSNRQLPFQNGSALKESEPLDSRPLKVRKKLFDLQLPADEYIDTEEVEKIPESSVKLPIGGQNGCQMNPIRIADLNEPIDIEETKVPSSVDFLSRNGENKGVNLLAKSNGGYLGENEETIRIRNGFLINGSVESKVHERGRLHPHTYETGSNQSLPTHSVQGIASREDLWPNRNQHGLQSSNRSHDHANSSISHLEPLTASQAPASGSFFNSSCFPGSWPQSVSSLWVKPTDPFTQKITALESCLNSSERSFRTSAVNGFYHGSASGCKTGFNFLSKGDISVASDRSTNHGYGYISNASSHADSKPAIDINLNEVVSKPEDHVSSLPWLKSNPANEMNRVHASVNQLRCKTETVTDLNQPFTPTMASSDCEIVSNKEISETRVKKILGFPIFEMGGVKNEPSTLATSEGDNLSKEKMKQKRMIDINLECEPDEQEEPTVGKNENQTKGTSTRSFIDLNSCVSDSEEDPSYERNRNTAKAKIALEIDLEAPVIVEDEDDTTPLPLQSLENTKEPQQDEENLKNAAEAIIAISSSCPKIQTEDTILTPSEASLAESLLLFVNADLETPSEEIDDFEAMTLEIQETKQEDYMPTPFVPEFPTVEETGANNTQATRSRRGQSRRGRQRRDFQRDILPGIASLSRHEVTEDIQTFGGLMRAMGHNWVSGLTRRNGARNGGTRGRKRASVVVPTSPVSAPLVQQLSNPEAALEDRSLTGWGKTIRRPRRQRCAAGNNPSPAVVLT